MKTDNSSIGKDAQSKNTIPVVISILPVMAMLIAVLPSVINRTTGTDTARLGIITLLLTGIAVFYIRFNSNAILYKRLVKTIIILCYLSAISLMLFIPAPEIFCFWMIGGLIIAMLIDIRLGLFVHFNLSLIMGIALPVTPDDFIQVLILGVLMILLAGALKQKSMVIYASIIILSTDITIAFAIHNFVFPAADNFNYFNSFFSLISIITAAFFISRLYSKADRVDTDQTPEQALEQAPVTIHPAEQGKGDAAAKESSQTLSVIEEETAAASDAETDLNKEEEIPIFVQEVKVQETSSDLPVLTETGTSYEVLCSLDNELIRKMKQYSENLYTHSVRIGDISYRAAMEIGADPMLALAGGLYHEIGKIYGKNYIEEGIKIAEDYFFPKALKAVIREHNIKFDKPNSVEAAIVMLSDSVESTIDYIEKNDDRKFTADKIIDNIFQMRMEKGTFDTSHLTIKDFKLLKEFYQKEYSR